MNWEVVKHTLKPGDVLRLGVARYDAIARLEDAIKRLPKSLSLDVDTEAGVFIVNQLIEKRTNEARRTRRCIHSNVSTQRTFETEDQS